MNKKLIIGLVVFMTWSFSVTGFTQSQSNPDTAYLNNLKNDVNALAKRAGVAEKNIDVSELKIL